MLSGFVPDHRMDRNSFAAQDYPLRARRMNPRMVLVLAVALTVGCGSQTPTPTTIATVDPSFRFELYRVTTTPGPTTKTQFNLEEQKNEILQNPAVFTDADVATLEVTRHIDGNYFVIVNPTPAGLARLKTATSPNGGQLAFVTNDVLHAVRYCEITSSNQFNLMGSRYGLFHEDVLDRVIAP